MRKSMVLAAALLSTIAIGAVASAAVPTSGANNKLVFSAINPTTVEVTPPASIVGFLFNAEYNHDYTFNITSNQALGVGFTHTGFRLATDPGTQQTALDEASTFTFTGAIWSVNPSWQAVVHGANAGSDANSTVWLDKGSNTIGLNVNIAALTGWSNLDPGTYADTFTVTIGSAL